ncbi:MAG: hypothetical protein SCJ93_07740 [Bacillota bacterium]|nr:hypothetical protein [Bacillota bacterium]
MKFIEEREVKKECGKKGFMSSSLKHILKYISGVPEIDEVIKNNGLDYVFVVDIVERKNCFEVVFKGRKQFTYYAAIDRKSIKQIFLEDMQQVYKEKERSVAGRALLGGVLFGPAGAIVGGMTGVKNKKKKQIMPEMVLSIIYEDAQGIEQTMVLMFMYTFREKVSTFFRSLFPKKFKAV